MKNFFYALAVACLLMTTGCGDDSNKLDPNAPIANQPGGANGWTTDIIKTSSENCADYGSRYYGTWQSWYTFCQCGYGAIAAVPAVNGVAKCSYTNFAANANDCFRQAQATINACEQSAGIGGSGSAYADTSLTQY